MTETDNRTRWALPPNSGVPEDRLEIQLNIYSESIILKTFDGGAVQLKMVSADDVAAALTLRLDFSSGLLPPDTLWWKQSEAGAIAALWRPPGVWPVALQAKAFEPPARLRLPMPGLLFICSPARPPWVFAAKARPAGENDELFRAPSFNVFADGRVCPGSPRFPQEPGEIPESFFQSYFSMTGDLRNRSRKYPDRLMDLWEELNDQPEYPLDDLVFQCTVADAMGLP